MHALVFQIRIHKREEASKLLNERFVPAMRQAPGFVAGYWVDLPSDAGVSVIVFDSEESVKAVMEGARPPQTEAFTVESANVGEVVAHA
jgi:hypothetical protein